MAQAIPRVFSAPSKLAMLLGAALTIACTGCAEDQSIRTYKIAKRDSGQRRGMPPVAGATVKEQMLAAIIPTQNSVWFFKLKGDPEKVDENRVGFQGIVDSVTFTGSGSPSWKLPRGWTAQMLQGMTYAKLLNEDESLTATVTQLAAPDVSDKDVWQKYIVDNVNRWRGQLSLENQDWEAIEAELEELEGLSHGVAKAYLVNLVGQGSGRMGGPFSGSPPMMAGSSNRDSSRSEKNAPEARPRRSPLAYTLPEHWSELDVSSSQMRLAAFSVEKDNLRGEVTVIAAGGDILANIGIWFGQVSLEKADESVQVVIDKAEKIEVNKIDALIYLLDGSETTESQSILIADIPQAAGGSLFVKLKGDSSLVASQRENYVEFLKSMKW